VCRVPDDLAVLGQDPRFGGGSQVQTAAFLSGAAVLGRAPRLLFDTHPGLGRPRWTWRRVEALRQLDAARRLAPAARAAGSLWVVGSLAQNGAAAARSRRPYGCWIGTTIKSELAGRAAGLPRVHRCAAAMSIPTLAMIERRVLQDARFVYATSPTSRAQIAATAGLDEEAVGIVQIPVDVERFRPASDAEWLEAVNQPVLVFVGRADDPRKNLPLLLGAFARIRKERPQARLLLAGRPPTTPLPSGVEATGEVADPATALRRAGLFVLPSWQEGFGIVAAEALATGVPVVTTPSGGPEDLVRRSGGGLVTEGFDEASLAGAVLSLLDRPQELVEMRRRGREHVEREHAPAAFQERLREALEAVDAA